MVHEQSGSFPVVLNSPRRTKMSENAEGMLDEIEDRYEDCDGCGGEVDTHEPGVYKTPDERFKHTLCEELGTIPPQYELADASDHATHTNTQYKCGHVLYGPPIEAPEDCPVCNVSDVDVARIDTGGSGE